MIAPQSKEYNLFIFLDCEIAKQKAKKDSVRLIVPRVKLTSRIICVQTDSFLSLNPQMKLEKEWKKIIYVCVVCSKAH